MARQGNPSSVSDAGVGALAARSAVLGAFMNVKINSSGLKDKALVKDYLDRGNQIASKTIAMEEEILSDIEKNFFASL